MTLKALKRMVPLFVLLLSALPSRAETLKVFTEELPPLNCLDREKNKAAGFSVEIVEGLLETTGIRADGGEIKVYPWARAYSIVEKEKNTMLFSMTRTEARESLFKWVGPLAPRTVWLWKLKSRDDIRVESFEDAKKYRTGRVYGFAISKDLRDKGCNIDTTTSIEQNWRKMFAGRIDLGTALEIEAAFSMKKFGKSYDELEKLIEVEKRYDFYSALNKDTSDRIVEMLQKALDRMKIDGTYQRIKESYLH